MRDILIQARLQLWVARSLEQYLKLFLRIRNSYTYPSLLVWVLLETS